MTGVVKLAQPGYNIRTAGDENLIYSSLWPLLKIYKQDSYTASDVTQNAVIVDHDLPFPPMYWFFSNTTINGWQNSGAITNTTRSEFFGPIANGSISVTDSQLKFTAGLATTGSLQLYYYIFALDLTKRFNAPIIKVGDVSGGSNEKRVFKIAKPGKDIHSPNLEDYVVHSRARSPLVHSVTPGLVIGGEFTVEHNLGYNPMYFPYTKNADGSYELMPTGSGGTTRFRTDENKITFTESGSGRDMTIVVLKDPFVIDQRVGVSI